MIFISAQPHDLYFQWQTEVQIVNFRKFGISDKMHILVWYPKGSTQLSKWARIQRKYPEVKIFLYQDEGLDRNLYIPIIRPFCLRKYFEKYPELQKEVIFYHDSDIIFNYLPDFDKLCSDNICWQSNTSSYLDYSYLRRKESKGKIPENEAINKLAEIGGITKDIIKSYDGKTGGAQYILKGIDYKFWKDVEDMCLEIRREFFHDKLGSINNRYFKTENLGFQSWCADMWAINFALWSRGIKTDITPELDFSWATDEKKVYEKKPIYHNAGSDGTKPGVFHKGKWKDRSPIGQDVSASVNSASWFYTEAIKQVINN